MNYTQFMAMLEDPRFTILFLIMSVWIIAWKGVALWKAAQNKSKIWFIILLIISDLGILEIVYIFYFSKPKTPKLPNS